VKKKEAVLQTLKERISLPGAARLGTSSAQGRDLNQGPRGETRPLGAGGKEPRRGERGLPMSKISRELSDESRIRRGLSGGKGKKKKRRQTRPELRLAAHGLGFKRGGIWKAERQRSGGSVLIMGRARMGLLQGRPLCGRNQQTPYRSISRRR